MVQRQIVEKCLSQAHFFITEKITLPIYPILYKNNYNCRLRLRRLVQETLFFDLLRLFLFLFAGLHFPPHLILENKKKCCHDITKYCSKWCVSGNLND